MAHLRNGDTYARLAAGFQIGAATAWRHAREAIAPRGAAADDDLNTEMRLLAYATPDGTLMPIDRVAEQKPYRSDPSGLEDRADRLTVGTTSLRSCC